MLGDMHNMMTLGANKSRRRGQAVVEFALVLPIFALLLFGAIEFGRAYLRLHLLTNAAREGARTGSIPGNVEADVVAAVEEFLTATGLDLTTCPDPTILVTDSGGTARDGGLGSAQQGDRVRVTVTHNFQVLSGAIIPGFQGTKTLTSTCVFRHE